jgi:hypothetical protein
MGNDRFRAGSFAPAREEPRNQPDSDQYLQLPRWLPPVGSNTDPSDRDQGLHQPGVGFRLGRPERHNVGLFDADLYGPSIPIMPGRPHEELGMSKKFPLFADGLNPTHER